MTIEVSVEVSSGDEFHGKWIERKNENEGLDNFFGRHWDNFVKFILNI